MTVSEPSETRTTKLQAKTYVAIVLWGLLGVVFYIGKRFAMPTYDDLDLPLPAPTELFASLTGGFLEAFLGGWLPLLPVLPGIVLFVASVIVRRRGVLGWERWISTISIVLVIGMLLAFITAILMPLISLLTILSS